MRWFREDAPGPKQKPTPEKLSRVLLELQIHFIYLSVSTCSPIFHRLRRVQLAYWRSKGERLSLVPLDRACNRGQCFQCPNDRGLGGRENNRDINLSLFFLLYLLLALFRSFSCSRIWSCVVRVSKRWQLPWRGICQPWRLDAHTRIRFSPRFHGAGSLQSRGKRELACQLWGSRGLSRLFYRNRCDTMRTVCRDHRSMRRGMGFLRLCGPVVAYIPGVLVRLIVPLDRSIQRDRSLGFAEKRTENEEAALIVLFLLGGSSPIDDLKFDL